MPYRLRLATVLLASVATPALAAEPAPVSALVERVAIPYQQFTLANGMRVLVHTDRKAPVVATSIWYHVGSKDEPKGKTGFAHLFEHLMFNGSENAPGDFFEPLQQVGATDMNGTTWYDRTNYFQTVPVAALERVLFLESDRMGHLLGGVTQEKLTNQIGVVQNEKRQGDNQPFGTADYVLYKTLFPAGHPYHHSTIGSMADLKAATLADTKSWFRAKYGPNNAVLVLAGDIDVATAKPLVEKWFGAIPRGPAVPRVKATVPTLAAPKTVTITDAVPYTRVTRNWAVEGVNGKDMVPLYAAAEVLGGLASSRLDNALVRGEASALNVSANLQAFEQVGVLTISADVKPGQDAAKVAARVDAIIADFLKNGPTADEVQRVATRYAANTIAGYESVGGFSGKATALAEGLLYSGDPSKYKTELRQFAALTPASVAAAARKWMGRPVFNLNIVPGKRDMSPEMLALTGGVMPAEGRGPAWYRKPGTKPAAKGKPVAAAPSPDRTSFPAVGEFPPLTMPPIERATLSNGIPVYFVRRTAVPTVNVAVEFDAGVTADAANRYGTQALTMALMREGTTSLDSIRLAEAQERLGARIGTGGGLDVSEATLATVSPNLAPSIALLADVVRNPAFAPAEFARVKGIQIGRVAAQRADPAAVARMILPEKVYGTAYPYGRPSNGLGSTDSLGAITRDDLIAFKDRWLRPDNARIFVVGDTTMAALRPMLEKSFGTWAAPAAPRGTKSYDAAVTDEAAGRIYLVDMPGKPQSVIAAGLPLTMKGTDPQLLVFRQSNDVIGSFLGRINMNLRETKGWSYGAYASTSSVLERPLFTVGAPVQTDRTGESVAEILRELKDFTSAKGTTAAEYERTTNGSIRALPGTFETSAAFMGALRSNIRYGRPDDYYTTLADKFRAMSPAQFDAASRAAIDPAKLTFVVVGDAASVRPQLAKLGLPVEEITLTAAK